MFVFTYLWCKPALLEINEKTNQITTRTFKNEEDRLMEYYKLIPLNTPHNNDILKTPTQEA